MFCSTVDILIYGKVRIEGLENVKSHTKAFVKTTITEFWDKHEGKRFEDMVTAKAEYASQLAEASGMTYQMIKGSEAVGGIQ